jgi:SAM-dependent methyltransferase
MSKSQNLLKSLNVVKYKNYCNLCDKYFETFLDQGEPVRKAVRCPDCNSLERHRFQWEFITKETRLLKAGPEKLKLLHVAPELTYYNKFAEIDSVDYIGIDLDPSHLGLENLNVGVGDVRKMKFKDNTFDVIICNHVLEHVIEDAAAMKEIGRVMKPDAVALTDIPIDYGKKKTYEDDSITTEEGRLKAFGQSDHVRIYGTDFFDRIRKAGLQVEKLDYQQKINPVKRRRMALPATPLIVAYKDWS